MINKSINNRLIEWFMYGEPKMIYLRKYTRWKLDGKISQREKDIWIIDRNVSVEQLIDRERWRITRKKPFIRQMDNKSFIIFDFIFLPEILFKEQQNLKENYS